MTTNRYLIELPEHRTALVAIEHNRGYDNLWAQGRLVAPDDETIAVTDRSRYLSFGCDTEIVATIIASELDKDLSPEIWQILEGQMTECRCDLDDEEDGDV